MKAGLLIYGGQGEMGRLVDFFKQKMPNYQTGYDADAAYRGCLVELRYQVTVLVQEKPHPCKA